MLWTSKYAPQSMKDIVGNKANAEKIQTWLHDWCVVSFSLVIRFIVTLAPIDDHFSRPNSLKSGFKKPGPNGLNTFRAILISGPPGIGKTTSAHVAARLEGYTPIELNASDARSKKLVEVSSVSNRVYPQWNDKYPTDFTTTSH